MNSQGERELQDKKKKDIWEKLDVVFKAIVALTVAFVSVVGSMYLQGKSQRDAKVSLYAQLMTNRERADSDLRKEMFNIVIKEFLEPKEDRIQKRVLAVEMLTYNFHDVIALGPLFKQLDHDISEAPEMETEKKKILLDRLRKVARETVAKQLATLGNHGIFKLEDVIFEDLEKSKQGGITVLDKELALPLQEDRGASKRSFVVRILRKDDKTKEMLVHVKISQPDGVRDWEIDNTFWLGYSDFPLIDNTRLKNGDRMAIVMGDWVESGAQLILAYFPASRASLKDKVYYDELVRQLLP